MEDLKKYTHNAIYPKFPYIVVDKNNDYEVAIGIKDRTLYITFLGSVAKNDWKHDFMFWKNLVFRKAYKNMKFPFFVHAGFLTTYKACQNLVHNYVLSVSEYDTIEITGHSLGAAVATLCAEDVAYLQENNESLKNKKLKCVISGSPMVFGIFTHKAIKERCKFITRVVYKGDLTPTLPSTLLGYTHVGQAVQIGKRFVNIFSPSCIYYHDALCYLSLDENTVWNKDNNWLYEMATNVYKKIYVGLAIGIPTLIICGLLMYNIIRLLGGL